jgi:TPP-dependent pyruvate/acetoin dehydrogenase alpha subunit
MKSVIDTTDTGTNCAPQRSLYRSLLRMRLVEERIMTLYGEQEMRCPTHFSIGQEAVAAGVCAHLRLDDYVISAHRSHAHYLGKGGDLKRMLAELYGKSTGCAVGKGGSMHLIDRSVGFIGCVPIVGSTIPIGVGVSLGAEMLGEDRLTVIFFGDGAVETGVFHESMNYAMVRELPILFVCENNLYSVNTSLDQRQPAARSIVELAAAYGMQTAQCDGQELDEVYEVAGDLINTIRTERKPAFVEFMTYRWLEHCGPQSDVHLGFRPEGEYEHWQRRDPVLLYEGKLCALTAPADIEGMHEEIESEIDEAVAYAKSSPFPARGELLKGIFA